MNNTIEKEEEVTATLVAHSGATKITRQKLSLIPAPPRTATHVPIRHIELVDTLERILKGKGLTIEQEEFAVQSDGMKLFGTLKLNFQITPNRPETKGYRFALGLRTSNDKSFPVQMIAGANVFVCDNLAFHGSMVTLKRRHTAHIDLPMELEAGVLKACSQFKQLRAGIAQLQAVEIDERFAKATILDAAYQEIMPLRLIPQVVKHYFEPLHEEFRERTMWSLHNAFTEAFKGLNVGVGQVAAMKLGKMFGV